MKKCVSRRVAGFAVATMGMRPGSLGFFNTAYDGPTHRRVQKTDIAAYREDFAYTDGSVSMYYALSWDLFPSHLPKDGDIWDFEQILWGSTTYTWNGIEDIHGRTTWGALKFKLSDAVKGQDRRELTSLDPYAEKATGVAEAAGER